MWIQTCELCFGWHLLQMVVEDAFVLLGLEGVDVLVEDGLELLDVIDVDLKVHESMTECRVAVGQLQVELGILESHLLDLEYLLHDLLV